MSTRAVAAVLLAVVTTSSCAALQVEKPQTFRKAADEARAGGRLVVGIPAPAGIDPGNITDASGALVSSLICEPLVALNPETGETGRGLLTSATTTGKGAVFILTLRKELRFHDGSELTSQDVVYALSRVARHDYASATAQLLRPVLGFDVISKALPPTETGDATKREITGVRALSKHAVEITLSERNAEFLRVLSLPLAAPVPRRLPDRDDSFAERPVCAGPYELVKPYRRGDATIELRRFADYYGSNDAYTRAGRGYADTIEFRLLPTREAELAAFRAGQLDVAHLPETAAAATAVPAAQLVRADLPQVELLGLPSGDAGFADPGRRAVLSRALDRRALVEQVYGGGRAPADRFVPPGLTGGEVPEPCREAVPEQGASITDADRALLTPLLGKEHELVVNDDFRNVTLARAVAKQWRDKLGLRVRVVGVPWSRYVPQVAGAQGARTLFRESWQPSSPSPDAVLFPLFHSRSIGQDNWARFSDRDFERRLDRVARGQTEDRLRAQQYAALEGSLCQSLPLLPLTFGQEEYLVRTERVAAAGGTFAERATGGLNLREIFVRGGG